MANEYTWSTGHVLVDDQFVTDPENADVVALVIHNIFCHVVTDDGLEVDAGPWMHELEAPDPDNFAPIISSEDDAEAAQEQRLGWIPEECFAQWQERADEKVERMREKSQAGTRRLD